MSIETINDQIDTEANAIAKKITGYDPDTDEELGQYKPKRVAYEQIVKWYKAGATPYREGLAEAEQKIKELTQWKKEASWLLDPLLEWGQGRKDIPLGNDITKEILRRAKLFTEAEQKAARYEKALKEIKKGLNWIENSRELDIIHDALTHKQTTDEQT